jgi:urease accessory protein
MHATFPAVDPWHGRLWLRLQPGPNGTRHQGHATAPLRLQRGFPQADGRLELPILHTAGGLVGGDRLSLEVSLAAGSRGMLTSVAAQKVYGTVGRCHQEPQGRWCRQELQFSLEETADLEWLPQELVLYADGLFEQTTRVELAEGASWLGVELVRLGLTAAGEGLGHGRWRSALEVVRMQPQARRWELVDRLELTAEGQETEHGMAGQPVFGSLVWVAPQPLRPERREALLTAARSCRGDLAGAMACGSLESGLVARYRGASSAAARAWFCRLWALIRREQGLAPPQLPRCWPFQEDPFAGLDPAATAAAAMPLRR